VRDEPPRDTARILEDAERARAQAETRARKLTALARLVGLMASAASGDHVFDEIARAATSLLDARLARVWLADEDAGVLRAVGGSGIDAEFERMMTEFREIPIGAGIVGGVFSSRRPAYVEDVQADSRWRNQRLARGAGLHTYVGLPLISGERALGVLSLLFGERRGWDEEDAELGGLLADHAAIALNQAELHRDHARQVEELKRAYGDLAAAQNQLVRTEKLRALGEMASGVAHDFNNLLAAILGRAQLGLQRAEDPKLRGWLEVIEQAAIDGGQTVRRLQEFTRIRRDERFVTVDLNQVVRDVLDITQSRWREEPRSRGATIEVRTVFADVAPVSGDPSELREALTNLILNAIDAMREGGTLGMETQATGKGIVLLVSDTGIGMSEAVRERIFDPFFTTKGPRGTGLGLSITYGILSRHAAAVAVESDEGRGTVFRLTFPAVAPISVDAEPPLVPDEKVLLDCLVVDDDAPVAAAIADMIAASGHRVAVLHDPRAAMARVAAERFDVVFTDLAMPEISGWEVARAVKATSPDVPVFLVTGFGVELSDDACRRHGLEAVLVKPVRLEDLHHALARAIGCRATRTSSTGEGS
jgi:signal transduction histidine kinase/CheY-like chemotaxis protein